MPKEYTLIIEDDGTPRIADDVVPNVWTKQRLQIVELGVYPGVPLNIRETLPDGRQKHFPATYQPYDPDLLTTSTEIRLPNEQVLTTLVNSLPFLAVDPERQPSPKPEDKQYRWQWSPAAKAYECDVLQRRSSHPETMQLEIITPDGEHVQRIAIVELHDRETAKRIDIGENTHVRFEDGTEAKGILGDDGLSAAMARLYNYDDDQPFIMWVPQGLSYVPIQAHPGGRTWTFGEVGDYAGGQRKVLYSGCLSRHLAETPDARKGQGVPVEVIS